MEELTRRIQRIDWKNIQRQATNVRRSTASALKDLVMTDLENKVRAATADTAWGASSSDLGLISQATYNREDYTLIMGIVWQRLGSSRWRCVLKGLDLLKHLICYGAHRVRDEAHAAMYHLRALENYRFVDKVTGRDHGAGIRERAQLVCALLADESLLEDYKRENDTLRNKVTKSGALSSDDYQMGRRNGGPMLGITRGGEYEREEGRNEVGSGVSGRLYDDVPGGSGGGGGGFGGFGSRNDEEKESAAGMAGNKNVDDLLGGSDPVLAIESAQAVQDKKNNEDGSDLLTAEKSGQNNDLNDILACIPDVPPTRPVNSGAQGSLDVKKPELDSGITDLMGSDSTDPTTTTSNPLTNPNNASASREGVKTGNTAYGGLVHFDNIMLGKGDRVEAKRPITKTNMPEKPAGNPFADASSTTATPGKSEPKTVRSNAKEDPFADLFSTAKKSGVL